VPPVAPLPPARVSDDGIPTDVFNILQARCSSCHTYGQGDLAGWGSVLDLSRMIDAEIVVPGSPATSRMLDRVQVRGDMPPKGDRVPTAEVAILRDWITTLKRPQPATRSDEDILDAIANDVNRQRSFASDFRYFSLAHFVDLGLHGELGLAQGDHRSHGADRFAGLDLPRPAHRSGLERGAVGRAHQLLSLLPGLRRGRPPGPLHPAQDRGAVRARRLVPRHREPGAAL
jgi:mono/diheme cytochrome c family protein